jgi:uncharacterized protein (UPF0335 family)
MAEIIASEQLRLFLERIERLEEEKKGIADDIKDVYSEAKSQGFDTPTMRAIIKLRKLDPESRREQEALLDTYKAALGMLDGTPLGKWAVERITKNDPKPAELPAASSGTDKDELLAQAIELVTSHQMCSTSWLQRQLKIGYNRAAGLIETMEAKGILSRPDGTGKREILAAGIEQSPAAAPEVAAEPVLTPADAHRLGREAAITGLSVTVNPFPAFDERRAAWDESWCAALGSDGMDIPDALKPAPKPAKPETADAPASDDE